MLCNVKLQSGTKYSAKAKKVKLGKTEKLLEPATGGAVQNMCLQISQNSQENTCARVSF